MVPSRDQSLGDMRGVGVQGRRHEPRVGPFPRYDIKKRRPTRHRNGA
ncbi:hypothetical protein Pd630_LPD00844 [Rhodococcus opacus PD630]|nr:hypothetical protein Pd630_LPD00844 [Rhodococcus opacus PD630]